MNAAERFLAATRAGDREAEAALLAPGVRMFNPVHDEPVVGREAVRIATFTVVARPMASLMALGKRMGGGPPRG